MLWIDHVIFGVRDLDVAGSRLLERHGLGSVPGGRHPGWGTGNRIVPLGPSYVELLAAVDKREAKKSLLGRSLLERVADGDRLMGWCAATSDIDAVAARLGLEVTAGSRVRPDGEVVRWRSAGLERAMQQRALPFFITWEGPPDLHPGRATAQHRTTTSGISWVEVSGDTSELREWLGGDWLPVRIVEGPPDIRAVGIASKEGEVVLP
jgi:hypothetical protein